MSINDFKSLLVRRAQEEGFEEFEVFAPSADIFQVRITQGEMQEFKQAQSSGVSFRGRFAGGKMGYSSSEALSESAVEFLLDAAKTNAHLLESEDEEPLYSGEGPYQQVESLNLGLEKVSTERKCEIAYKIEEAATQADERVVAVDAAVLGTAQSHLVIANSLGLDVSHRANIAYAYVMVRVSDGGEPKVGFDSWAGRDLDQLNPKTLAQMAVNKALAQLGASKPDSGLFRVVFNNETAGDLFACFAPSFYAENVQKGFSLMAGMSGKRIASSKLTIRDDGYIADALGAKPFDYEGVPTQNKSVVEQGVLNTLLYNLKAAHKDGVMSTGNGLRRGLGGSVTTGCSIFYVAPSQTSFEEVLAYAGEGVLITSLMGLHSGTNVVSGEFSLQASGFVIKDGKQGAPLEQMVVSGNFYSLINDILEVGSDLYLDIPSSDGRFGAPSILVSSLPIAGV